MSLKDIDISCSYDTGEGSPLTDFYIPCLSECSSYDRIAGYFSSTSMLVSARGIAGLIKNKGKMRLLASPNLSKEDIKAISENNTNVETYISNSFIEDVELITNTFERDHLSALGWMLSSGYLDIKLVYIVNEENENLDRLFHQKIGIIGDDFGNKISFSGSINETASGWLKNVEEFKVFKEWEDGQRNYYLKDKEKFDKIWKGERSDLKVVEISRAIKDKLYDIGKEFDKEEFIAKSYLYYKKEKEVNDNLNLFFYQKNAIEKWTQNNYKLLFEMATGTGKTRTAVGCMAKIKSRDKKFVVIIACPQGTLSLQWKKEIEKLCIHFDESIIADGTNRTWKEDLKTNLCKVEVGLYNNLIIYTTHRTLSNVFFVSCIEEFDLKYMLIGDEAHGLGAFRSKKGLIDKYIYRIGLSATPSRWFDDLGSAFLKGYFGDCSFEFTIADALSTINPITGKPFLVNYNYYPIFLSLNEEELSRYEEISNKISKLSNCNRESDNYQKLYEKLLFLRANILKNASNKYAELEKVLRLNEKIENTIIFVSDEQIDEVMKILNKYKIPAHRFTQIQGTIPKPKFGGLSEREYIINNFKNGVYKVLVAIKCLDEGIDIPSADTAIIMATSSNPREHIQRTGRVIRQNDGKHRAKIYDFIIEPDFENTICSEILDFEKVIFGKELIRVSEMSMNAINNAEVLGLINSKIRRIKNGLK